MISHSYVLGEGARPRKSGRHTSGTISLVLPPPVCIIYLPPSFLRLATGTPNHPRLNATKRDTDFHQLDMYESESGERLATVRSAA